MTATEMVVTESVIETNGLGGLFDPQAEGALTDAERSLIGALLDNGAQADQAIPDDISSEELWASLTVCCKIGSRLERVRTALKMLVGRALVVMENRPEIYKLRGFVTLDGFMSSKGANGLPALTGIARGGLYEAKGFATKWPEVPIVEMAAIGVGKMRAISRIRKGSDSDAREWLDRAKGSTLEKLEEQIYRSNNGIREGDLTREILTIEMSKADKTEILEFLANIEFQAYCQSDAPGVMLTQAIAEASNEWALSIREQEDPTSGAGR